MTSTEILACAKYATQIDTAIVCLFLAFAFCIVLFVMMQPPPKD